MSGPGRMVWLMPRGARLMGSVALQVWASRKGRKQAVRAFQRALADAGVPAEAAAALAREYPRVK